MTNFAAQPIFQAQPLHGTTMLDNPPGSATYLFMVKNTAKGGSTSGKSWFAMRQRMAVLLQAEPGDLTSEKIQLAHHHAKAPRRAR